MKLSPLQEHWSDFKLLNLEMGIEISYDYTHKDILLKKTAKPNCLISKFAGRIF